LGQHFPFYSSLRAKASVLFFAVFLVIILPVNYIIYGKVRSTLAEADTKELRAEADKIAGQVRLDPLTIPLPPLGYSLQLQRSAGPVPIVLFASPEFPVMDPGTPWPDVIEYDTIKVVTVPSATDPLLTISMARSNRRLADQTQDLKVYLFAANAGAIVLAGILVFGAAGWMLRPIRKIMNVAEGITASNSIGRVPVPNANDESRQLAETINRMLERIEFSIRNQINFFASATHELKTPLAVMQTELSLALSQSTDAAARKILESQLTEVQRLTRVIHDFLLISQLKSNSLTLRSRPESLEEVVYASLRKVKYRSQERNSQIRVTLPDTPVAMVHLDFDKMETVIANLMENAIRYAPAGSIIEIVIAEKQIRVINPTLGLVNIPSELDQEFKPSRELSSGLGMGLWLCNNICKLHQASLTVKYDTDRVVALIQFS
jgi:signal transduction histidine kinase